MDAIPVIGKGFQTFFPCFLAILVFVNYFEVWSNICKHFSLDDLAFTEVFEQTRVENGRALLKMERNRQPNRNRNLNQDKGDLEMRQKQPGGFKNNIKRSSGSSEDETKRLLYKN